MTKQEAIALFRSRRKLAEALGITTQAVGQWPDRLTQRIADRVMGAKQRTKKAKANGTTAVPKERP